MEIKLMSNNDWCVSDDWSMSGVCDWSDYWNWFVNDWDRVDDRNWVIVFDDFLDWYRYGP